jgi:hypothetical protein
VGARRLVAGNAQLVRAGLLAKGPRAQPTHSNQHPAGREQAHFHQVTPVRQACRDKLATVLGGRDHLPMAGAGYLISKNVEETHSQVLTPSGFCGVQHSL